MRVLITGGAGLLGGTLAATAPDHAEVHVTERRTPAPFGIGHRVELADAAAVLALAEEVAPDLVIHTAYDSRDVERDIVTATAAVAAACAATGARLIHLSSDRVLNGEHAPYDERALADPVEPYGAAKARAEELVREALPDAAIVRTSLIVRTEPPDRITERVLRTLRESRPLRLFIDELRCPIHVDDLSAQIWEIAGLKEDARGVWNLVGPEALSRFAQGVLIARAWKEDGALLMPALNRDHAERRPRDLRLTTGRAIGQLRTAARPISEALLG